MIGPHSFCHREVELNKYLVWAVVGAAAIGGVYYYSAYGPMTQREAEVYGRECENWISKDVGDGAPAKVNNHWKKRGKLVFEVLVKRDPARTSSTAYLCVVDKAAGTLFKPSAFSARDWQ